MAPALYFTALRDYMEPDGGPVTIAGVRCRFRKDRHYEIPTRGNDKLVAALREEIKAGNLRELDIGDGVAKVAAQGDADRKRRQEARAARGLPVGSASAKVEVSE